uniref:Uncharacterized protein n=1 Tax=Neobodo designis TaxID=312471 RepID=A0A7S1WAV8_NEODS|mmetsp:Transcript_9662/g.29870  ORF Transcript_9662/g.29870 Transcript_9662/m.29870 type:complete len:189 (+) Transcript_9662:40-606(+)
MASRRAVLLLVLAFVIGTAIVGLLRMQATAVAAVPAPPSVLTGGRPTAAPVRAATAESFNRHSTAAATAAGSTSTAATTPEGALPRSTKPAPLKTMRPGREKIDHSHFGLVPSPDGVNHAWPPEDPAQAARRCHGARPIPECVRTDTIEYLRKHVLLAIRPGGPKTGNEGTNARLAGGPAGVISLRRW